MQNELFEKALGITAPWFIKSIKFNLEEKRLDIKIDFEKGSKFFYQSSEESENISGNFPVHDTVEKTWRHLNFFQHDCYLSCRVPRVKLDNGKVRQVKTPWEGINNGFTLLLEAFLLQLCQAMPVASVSKLSGIEEKRIWRMLNNYIKEITLNATNEMR